MAQQHQAMDIDKEKARLRRDMAARRDARPPDDGTSILARFRADVLPVLVRDGRRVVSAFWPMGSEVDVAPVCRMLDAEGVALALPVVEAKGRPLLFRAWRPGDPVIEGVWRIPVPRDDAPPVTPEAMIVPLLAFDDAGNRLGYGGGFYDRTIEALRRGPRPPLAIGVAFACQRVARVPHTDLDQRLDMAVTESAVHRFADAAA